MIKNISTEKAINFINKFKSNENFAIIDIRTPQEYNWGHFEKAISIDYLSKDFKSKINKLDRDKTYIVHCRTGKRSSDALKIFEELNFNNILHMNEGIIKCEKECFSM